MTSAQRKVWGATLAYASFPGSLSREPGNETTLASAPRLKNEGGNLNALTMHSFILHSGI